MTWHAGIHGNVLSGKGMHGIVSKVCNSVGTGVEGGRGGCLKEVTNEGEAIVKYVHRCLDFINTLFSVKLSLHKCLRLF